MTLSLNNYNKPSHKKAKLIGDICLFAIPIYSPIIASMPLNGEVKTWIISILAMLLGTVKIISKFTIDPNYVDKDNKDNTATSQQ